jgi:uncharacterized protein with NRDE domain
LVLIGWCTHPDYRLIVAANRDEYHVRRSTSLQPWPETPGLLAGRDLDCGRAEPGIWLGLRPGGSRWRFAAITNVHDTGRPRADTVTRGGLAREYLSDTDDSPQRYAQHTIPNLHDKVPGYQLVVSDAHELWWAGNRAAPASRRLDAGFHALTNDAQPHTLDDRSAETGDAFALKARQGLEAFAEIAATGTDRVEDYLAMMSDRTPASAYRGPAAGLPPTLQRMYSARFVSNALYGTRSSTVVLIRQDGSYTVAERSFGPRGRRADEVSFSGRTAGAEPA